jgi:D-proline reductase (dithiol) PrdB
MVYLSEMPKKQRDVIVNQDLPDYQNTPCVDGPPLSRRKISIITTAGLHRKEDTPFTPGVGEYRVIPDNTNMNDLIMSHVSTNFDRTGFHQDLNVMFPIDLLNQLKADGKIAEVASYHYSFMGATPPMAHEAVSKDLSLLLKSDGVDGVILAGV